jgi:uncharacterized tellurite resistance protein B-like protein
MPLRFLKFFSSAQPASDGLTQAQREAIADTLHYIVYADNHIAAREGDFVSGTIEALSWDTSLSFSAYEVRSIANARRAREDAAYRTEFFAFIAARLDTPASRSRTLDLARSLVYADGAAADGESDTLDALRAALKA